MAKANIFSGICGFNTIVEATKVETDDGDIVRLSIQSECKNCQRLGTVLTEVDPYREITYRGEGPLTLKPLQKFCPTRPAPCRPVSSRQLRSPPDWLCPPMLRSRLLPMTTTKP